MPLIQSLWRNGPPVLRALAAQAAIFPVLAVLAWMAAPRVPFWCWPAAQGLLSALLAHRWGLNRGWLCFQMLLPLALAWQLGHAVPPWVYPAAFLGFLLVFGGGLLTRVPLYNSSHSAWHALLELIPPSEGLEVVDLGAGLGGPLVFLARRLPAHRFTGVEASPVVWLLAWLRAWPHRANCRMRLGSLWRQPLTHAHVVYAFLSPAPMADLWAKARREMPPGSILISNTFEIPGVQPERIVQLPDRRDARLLVYRPDGAPREGDSQELAG